MLSLLWVKDRIKVYIPFVLLFLTSMISSEGFCDILRLKEIPEGADGHSVEILEEREESFVVKIPKEEIEVIKRKRPTEIELWKEKMVLWEDMGDYVAIYLPKEKIVLPEDYKGDEYDSAKALKNQLKQAGQEGRPPQKGLIGLTGSIAGRILKKGKPLAGAKVKIVNVSAQAGRLLSRLLSPGEDTSEFIFETQTDESGVYRFRDIPIGDYDIYWSIPESDSWYRRLSEKPDITVRPGQNVKYRDIDVSPSG